MLTTLVAIRCIDHTGRKTILCGGTYGMYVCMYVLCVCMYVCMYLEYLPLYERMYIYMPLMVSTASRKIDHDPEVQ